MQIKIVRHCPPDRVNVVQYAPEITATELAGMCKPEEWQTAHADAYEAVIESMRRLVENWDLLKEANDYERIDEPPNRHCQDG